MKLINYELQFQKKVHPYYLGFLDVVAESRSKSSPIQDNFHQPNGLIQKLCTCIALEHKRSIM